MTNTNEPETQDRQVPSLLLATVDSGSFSWTALGETVEECDLALIVAYDAHVRATPGAEIGAMLDLIEVGDVNYYPINVGTALRDGSPVT